MIIGAPDQPRQIDQARHVRCTFNRCELPHCDRRRSGPIAEASTVGHVQFHHLPDRDTLAVPASAPLARYERDVLSLPAVSHVIILVGINDIGFPGTAIVPSGIVRTADEIIAGYKQLIERAHLRGLKVIASPLTPLENALANGPNVGYFSPYKEAKRQTVNNWIRTSKAFD
jgi:hypothetical protein